MIIRSFSRLALWGMLALVLVSVMVAVAAANTVPATNTRDVLVQNPIAVNDLKPTYCASLNLTSLVTGSGAINGTNGNNLILGSAVADTINGRGGADCIVAGGGNDTIAGGAGADICDGGPGTDTATSCATTINIP